MCEFNDIIPGKRRQILQFITETEENSFLSLKQNTAATDEEMKNISIHFGRLREDVKEQCERLKQEIDKISNSFVSLVRDLEHDNMTILATYKEELEDRLYKLKDPVKDYKCSLQEGTNIHIFNNSKDVESRTNSPMKPTVRSVTFTPNKTRKSS